MDVVSVGGIVTDISSYCPRFPRPGETLNAHHAKTGCGGKAANQAVMATKLGAKTALVGKLGDDFFGKMHLEGYQDHGVNSDFVSVTKEAGTAIACITVTDDGMNCISVANAANCLLSEDDVMKAEPLIKTAKVLITQLETTHQTTLAALRVAKKYSVTTVFNAAPPCAEPLFDEMFTLSDVFCVNETEAETFTGLPVANVEDAKKAVTYLLNKGCKAVIVTLGAAGCVFADQDKTEPSHVPAEAVKAVDSSGAGDAFVGAFSFYTAKFPHLSFKERITRAVSIATISVKSEGTQSSFPMAKDLPSELLK